MLTASLAARRRQSAEEGFTLIELIVTMAVISGVLLGLLAVQTSALSTVTLSRERQQATDLANRTMEQLRALPYDLVAAGLLDTDAMPAADPNITLIGGVRHFQPPGATVPEPLVTHAVAGCPVPAPDPIPAICPPVPLFPHVQAGALTKIGKVQFTVRSYVTLVNGAPNNGYWLTVDVSWSSAPSGGRTKRVRSRTQAYSPTGCLKTSTHPFSGPCQAFFDASAGTTPASISLTSDVPGSPLLLGNSITGGSVSVPSLSAVVQAEQIVSTQSVSSGSQARYSTSLGEQESVDDETSTTVATTDPATGEATTPAHVVKPSSALPLDAGSSTDNVFRLAPASSSVDAASTTRATNTANGCKTTTGAGFDSNQVCSSGSTTSTSPTGGTIDASLTYGPTAFSLASIGGAASPARVTAARFVTSAGPYCTAAVDVGCVVADVERSFGATALGGVPSTAEGLPAAFTTSSSLLSVSGYTAKARSESGLGAEVLVPSLTDSTPRATARAGTVSWWSGTGPTGYQEIELDDFTPRNETLAPVTFHYPGLDGDRIDVTMTGTVSVSPPTRTPTPLITPTPVPAVPLTCTPDACGMEESSGAVTAAVTYELRNATTVVGRFTVSLDLGTASARTTYRAAPSA